ncbi:MAG: SDR family NAD(P)-dependent oxidoreductase [Calditrichaeota bacterium]|nr:MAG: SDR family NAD(P)-dependent oxidoreductase [Calditrichota bacterium]
MANSIDYSTFRGKNVLITGGLGFIGSNIAHKLVKHQANVTLFDACLDPYGWNPANIRQIESRVKFIKGDVRDFDALKKAVEGQHLIYHLAAQVGREISMEDPWMDTNINCNGTLNLLEICRKWNPGAKIVYAGSRGQIGEPQYLPVDENHPCNPTDIYGINKLAAEKYLFLYSHVYGMPVVSLRLNNVYGERCQMHNGFYGILNWFIANAMTEKPITVYGEGKQTRDYVYIEDVVDAFLRAGISPAADGEVFFVGSGVETVFLDMVNEIVRAVGQGEIVHVPFPETREKIDIKRFVVTYQKINQRLGWEPRYDLRTGIERTVAFYREYLPDYLKQDEKQDD